MPFYPDIGMVDVSAVIIHFGKAEYTTHVLDCLKNSVGGLRIECIVIDNASETPPDSNAIQRTQARIIHVPNNKGYGAACNVGARLAQGRYILILNNDLDIPLTAVAALVRTMDSHPDIGVLGPMLRFTDGRYQLSWGKDPRLLSEFMERNRQRRSRNGNGLRERERLFTQLTDVDWVTGAAMLLRRETMEIIGGFDEAYHFYFEDVDLCKRIRAAGFRVAYEPSTFMIHFGGASSPQSNTAILRSYRLGQLRYYARYNSALQFIVLKFYLMMRISRFSLSKTIYNDSTLSLINDIASFQRKNNRAYNNGNHA